MLPILDAPYFLWSKSLTYIANYYIHRTRTLSSGTLFFPFSLILLKEYKASYSWANPVVNSTWTRTSWHHKKASTSESDHQNKGEASILYSLGANLRLFCDNISETDQQKHLDQLIHTQIMRCLHRNKREHLVPFM